MISEKIKNEMIMDSHRRGVESALGHVFINLLFLGICFEYLKSFPTLIIICIINIISCITRIYFTKKLLSNYQFKFLTITNINIFFNSLMWGTLFSYCYLKFGFYQLPTISLFTIIAGLSATGTSTLYPQKKLLLSFLIPVLILPSFLMFYKEVLISEKLFGGLLLVFFFFLTRQAFLNHKNLKNKLEVTEIASDQHKNLSYLFKHFPGIYLHTNISGGIITKNSKFEEFLNFLEINPKSTFEISNDFLNFTQGFINSNKKFISKEFNFSKNDISKDYICNLQKSIANNELIFFFFEITHLKNIEKEIKQKDAHLQHSGRLIELGEVVGAIAHEINNPLSVVAGRTQVSKRMLSKDNFEIVKLIQNLNIIEASSIRISKLVSGMKTLVRNAENDPPTLQSLTSHLEIVDFLVSNKAKNKEVNFQTVLETSALEAFCRPSQIEQVLINVINNAIDAAEFTDEKWVKLTIKNDEKFLIFEVSDSGKGIKEEILNKIWNPFFTTKELGKGTGLGLSISQSIIRENSGEFYYDKNYSNTTFVIKILRSNEISNVA